MGFEFFDNEQLLLQLTEERLRRVHALDRAAVSRRSYLDVTENRRGLAI